MAPESVLYGELVPRKPDLQVNAFEGIEHINVEALLIAGAGYFKDERGYSGNTYWLTNQPELPAEWELECLDYNLQKLVAEEASEWVEAIHTRWDEISQGKMTQLHPITVVDASDTVAFPADKESGKGRLEVEALDVRFREFEEPDYIANGERTSPTVIKAQFEAVEALAGEPGEWVYFNAFETAPRSNPIDQDMLFYISADKRFLGVVATV